MALAFSAVHLIALALTARGGEAPEEGILASALGLVRSRAKITRGSKLSGAGLRELFLRALDPIVRLTQEAFEENDLPAPRIRSTVTCATRFFDA